MKGRVLVITLSSLLSVPAWPRAEAAGASPMIQAETSPPGWRQAKSKALDLTLSGKDLEVVAVYEKFVAQYPKFAEAEFMLGAAHESAARATIRSRAPDASATRATHFDAAILHMRRGLELAGRQAPFDWMRGFIDIHGLVGVNRPEEYERLVREAVTRYPTRATRARLSALSPRLKRASRSMPRRRRRAARFPRPPTGARTWPVPSCRL